METPNPLQTTQLFLEAALSLHKIREYFEALRLVKKALREDPKNTQVLVLQGLIYQDIGEIKKAEKQFRKALKYTPNDPDALKSLGLFLISQQNKPDGLNFLFQYIHQGQWQDQTILETILSVADEIYENKESVKVLKQCWEKTLNPKIGQLYASNLTNLGRSEDAIPLLELLTNHSGYHEYWYELGINYLWGERYEEAIEAFQTASDGAQTYNFEYSDDDELDFEMDKAESSLGVYWCDLSDAYARNRQPEKALETAEKALKRYSNGVHPWSCKVSALMALSRYPEVIETAKHAINHLENQVSSQDLRSLYFDWVIALLHYKRFDDAFFEVLSKAREKIRSSSFFYLLTEGLYQETGHLEEALKVIEAGLKVEWDDAPIILIAEYYQLLHKTGQGDSALEKVKMLVTWEGEETINDVVESISSDLDRYLYASDDLAEYQIGARMTEQLYEQFSGHPNIAHRMFELQFGQRNWEKAEATLSRSLDYDLSIVSRLETLNNLGYLYLQWGRLEQAQNALEQAQNIEISKSELAKFGMGVAFFKEDQIINDPLSKESAFLKPISQRVGTDCIAIIKTNLISLALAQGNVDKATTLALELITDLPDNSLGYEVYGTVAFSKSELETTIFAWRKAISLLKDLSQTPLMKWLDEAESKVSIKN